MSRYLIVRVVAALCLWWATGLMAQPIDGGWTMRFYATGDVSCRDVQSAQALSPAAWQPAATAVSAGGMSGRRLWVRLDPSDNLTPVKLVLLWHSNSTLFDWRDSARAQTEHESGHAPGFEVIDLPTLRSSPLLLCMFAPAPDANGFVLWPEATLQSAERRVTLMLGGAVGVMLAMCIFALTFFLRAREPVFGIYALYVLSMVGYLLFLIGALTTLLPAALANSPLEYALGATFIGLFTVTGLRFTLRFTGLDQDAPRVAWALRLLSTWVLVATLLVLLSVPPISLGFSAQLIGGTFNNIAAVAMILVVMPLVVRAAWRGRREARIYLLGWLPLLLLLAHSIFVILGVLPVASQLSPLWLVGAVAFETIVLGWGLMDRARRDRSARDLAIHQATHDPLTGLHNRAAVHAQLAQPAVGTLVYVDIDYFKRINDRHGHAVGDRCLRHCAQICGAQLRSIDLFARYGGEEFLIWLPRVEQAEAERRAEQIREAVEVQSAQDVAFTISIGLAPRHTGEPLEDCIARADQALYRAKDGGRNRVESAA